jgi:N-acetylglucosaminyldiphosphoundecaprenol N-acetyl-beta-D-mannosaminyltransferase
MPETLTKPAVSFRATGPVLSPAPCFPERVWIEGVPVDTFACREDFLSRLLVEIEKPALSVLYHLNIHGANIAHRNPLYKRILQDGDVVFCDGAGIVMGAALLGKRIPIRLPVMDWIYPALEGLAEAGKSVYFLAGEPGVAERALQVFHQRVPQHTIVGMHHGYILQNPHLEAQVIDEINRLSPDLLFVGFGMPLQEFWVTRNRSRLNVGAICPIGAALDYVATKVPRCPDWVGSAGLEWLFRLGIEPKRLFSRYVQGNPWFLSRILATHFSGG